MALYNFAIPKFHIESTRSRRSDTLYAGTSLTVMNANGSLHEKYPPLNLSLGDKEDKIDVFINIPFTHVYVEDPTPQNPDGGSITWAFLLTNTGTVPSEWTAIFNKALDAVAGGAAGKAFDGSGPTVDFIAVAVAALAAQGVLDFFTADCDGVVVTEGFSITAAQLASMTAATTKWSTAIGYQGTPSPAGCGDNSIYDVRYSIEQLPRLTLPAMPTHPDRLTANQGLVIGQTQSITSSDARFTFTLQNDANLVVYGPGSKVLWASNTYGHLPTPWFMAMQTDGNLVVYDTEESPFWASNTAGNPGAWVSMQSDGNLVIYSAAGKAIWATNTVQAT